MARKSYVAGVINQLDTLEFFIGEVVPEVLAYEFLRSTLMDVPRPPWQTGSLRRSGSAYVGQRKVTTTLDVAIKEGRLDLLGVNTNSPWYKGTGLIGHGIDERITDTSNDFYSTPLTARLRKLKTSGQRRYSAITTMAGKVTVMYQAPHAALMHEWNGTFSDTQSGAHFVSSKALMSTQNAALKIAGLSARHLR